MGLGTITVGTLLLYEARETLAATGFFCLYCLGADHLGYFTLRELATLAVQRLVPVPSPSFLILLYISLC